MISLNATMAVQLILFLILLYVLNKMMIQPLHKLVLEREEHLAARKGELASAHESLKQVAADYKDRLRRAEMEARAAHAEVHRVASDDAQEILMDAQHQVTDLRHKVRDRVAQELDKARKDLKKQAETLSFDISQKVIGRRV